MVELRYDYRLTDMQCALGLSQLRKLPASLERRRQIARRYREPVRGIARLELPVELDDREHAWHLYPVRVSGQNAADARERLLEGMRAAHIGVNVHYRIVYAHSYYQALGYPMGLCPVAEAAANQLLSLPMWHGLTDEDQTRVIDRFANLMACVD